MNEYIVIALFILWYSFSLVVSETLGRKKKLGVEWSFFICMMVSPLIGYFFILMSKDNQPA